MQANNEVAWCIACVATDKWAKKVFPKSIDAKNDLWEHIFKMCLVNKYPSILVPYFLIYKACKAGGVPWDCLKLTFIPTV